MVHPWNKTGKGEEEMHRLAWLEMLLLAGDPRLTATNSRHKGSNATSFKSKLKYGREEAENK